ncbi:MAG: hypothetical protein IKP77_04835 [Acholeplasmatales bacterium]|nr:hypothetical protein [Acholeplasmatales bacterium]
MRRKINLISSLVTLAVTVFLLIAFVYSWYVTNKTVSANAISGTAGDPEDSYIVTFNLGDEKVDVPMIPGNFSMLQVNISGEGVTNARLAFRTPRIAWKNIVTEYTALASAVDFEKNVYYNSDNELLATKPNDWATNYSSYKKVTDNVITVEEVGTKEVSMPLERLYGVNSYFTKTGEDTYKKINMSLGEKRAEFLKLWRAEGIDMSEAISVYVSDELIEEKDYETELLPLYQADEFGPIANNNVTFNGVNSNGKTMYFYFYFDATDTYFNTSGDTYFYGENPYFLQTCTLDLVITKSN